MDLAARAGCRGIELVLDPEVLARGSAWVVRRAKDAGVSISSLHPFLYELPGRLARFSSPRMLVQIASDIGCPVVTVHPPAIRDRAHPRWAAYLNAMEEAQVLAARSGVRLSLENPPLFSKADEAKVLGRIEDLAGFCEERGWEITLDTSHAWSAGDDVLAACRRVLGRLVNVHLSDVRRPPRWLDHPLLDSTCQHHQVPGEGVLPLEDLLQLLLAHGYRGPLTLELSPMALGWPLPRAIARRLAVAVTWVEERLARDRGANLRATP